MCWWWCYLLACLARALVFSLLMAALSYPPSPLKKSAFIQSKMSALSLVCVQSSIQKLQEYYFAVLIYKFLIYVKHKGEDSFYYNIKIFLEYGYNV